MPRCSIANARVAWIVGGCRGCGVFVRTIVSRVRFHSMTGFGAGAAAGALPGAGGGATDDDLLFVGVWARAAGAAKAEAVRPSMSDSLRRVICYLS
jgi:hypothetical protein